MSAAQGGHVDTVKLMLDSGSDVEGKDNVSTRRCITTYMYVYTKWWMSLKEGYWWDEMKRDKMIVDSD